MLFPLLGHSAVTTSSYVETNIQSRVVLTKIYKKSCNLTNILVKSKWYSRELQSSLDRFIGNYELVHVQWAVDTIIVDKVGNVLVCQQHEFFN